MTKRSMTKKFMRETGADKKTAMDYLRKCQWNYGKAKTLYYAPEILADIADGIASIDWSELIKKVADAIQAMTEIIVEWCQSDEFQAACRAVIEERRNADDGMELCEPCTDAFYRFMGINTPGGGYEKLDSEVLEK